MSSLKAERVSGEVFEALAQQYPNATEYANYADRWLIVGARQYITSLVTR